MSLERATLDDADLVALLTEGQLCSIANRRAAIRETATISTLDDFNNSV